MTLSLGIDLGTSGIRCAVIHQSGELVAISRGAYPDDSAEGWWQAVAEGLEALTSEVGTARMKDIRHAAVDGTSGSMVLTNERLEPVTPPLMYNSNGFDKEAEHIASYAPPDHITGGPASAFARLLRLQSMDAGGAARHLCHQADFILAKLTGQAGHSDENNCLKTGYDVEARKWPEWFAKTQLQPQLLPEVHPVGRAVGPITADIAATFGLSPTLTMHVGTTDSIAAFLATGVSQIGDVVTSLGTTLAIKMLSNLRIDDAAQGIYSHRLGDKWLVGGASNTGGGALLAHFPVDEIASLSTQIDPSKPTGLEYYPLPRPGERFPINDPNLEPVVTPRPTDDAIFLQALFEGIARIEARCYEALHQLGAPDVRQIFTAGGGATNPTWRAIRAQYIDKPLHDAVQTEAAIGSARLAAGLI